MTKKKRIILWSVLVFIIIVMVVTFIPMFGCNLKIISLDIIDDDPFHPVFVIADDRSWLFSHKEIHQLLVSRSAPYPEKGKGMWAVYAGQDAKETEQIKYGVLPDGYKELLENEELVVGEQYVATIYSRGSGGIVFTITEEKGKAKLVVLDKT
jgi:hypothetical protein